MADVKTETPLKISVSRASEDWKKEPQPVQWTSLEDLTAFIDEHGSIIISPANEGLDVTIYDDYVE